MEGRSIVADLFEKASVWLQDQRVKFLSHMVVYQRGTETCELAATIGRTVFEQSDDYGIVHKTESRDFLIRASDLVIAGTTMLPRAGDRVREGADGRTFVYEVMGQNQRGECPPWRYSDSYRQTLRIHTKLIATEEN
jgi:hypothetical protein